MRKAFAFALEVISLQTERGRLVFALMAHVVLLIVPYAWLSNLSLYKLLGINSPTIGLTRAYWLLIHGRPADAWERNWLIFPVMAVGWSIVALDVWHLCQRSSWLTQKNRSS